MVRAVRRLALMKARRGDGQNAITLIEKVLQDKRDITTPFIRVEALATLTSMYLNQGAITDGQLDNLQQAYQQHHAGRASSGAMKSGFQQFEANLNKLKEL